MKQSSFTEANALRTLGGSCVVQANNPAQLTSFSIYWGTGTFGFLKAPTPPDTEPHVNSQGMFVPPKSSGTIWHQSSQLPFLFLILQF